MLYVPWKIGSLRDVCLVRVVYVCDVYVCVCVCVNSVNVIKHALTVRAMVLLAPSSGPSQI